MVNKLLIFFFFFWLIPFGALANFNVSDFRYYKEVIGEPEDDFILEIDSDIYKHSSDFFSDLMVMGIDGEVLHHKIFQKRDYWEKKETERELDFFSSKNTYIIDRGEKVKYDGKIFVESESINFSRKFSIWGSYKKNGPYKKINSDDEIIKVKPGQSDLEIDFNYNNYRFLKIFFNGNEGNFKLNSFKEKKEELIKIEGEKNKKTLKFRKWNGKGDYSSAVIIETPFDNFPLDFLEIETHENDFEKKIEIYGSNDLNSKFLSEVGLEYSANENFWKKIYQGNFKRKIYNDGLPSFKINDNKKYYLIFVKDLVEGENIESNGKKNKEINKINFKKITGISYRDFIYISLSKNRNQSIRLFYGGDRLLKPNYQINLKKYDLLKRYQLSQEKTNEFFKEKKKFKLNYMIIFYTLFLFLFLIFLWFIYKITKENLNKDKDDIDFLDKL